MKFLTILCEAHGWLITICRNEMIIILNKCDDGTVDYLVWQKSNVPKAEVIYTSSIFKLASTI